MDAEAEMSLSAGEPPQGSPELAAGVQGAPPPLAAAAAANGSHVNLELGPAAAPAASTAANCSHVVDGPLSPAAAALAQHQRVVLRVEVATKAQARLLTWSVLAFSVVFCVVAALVVVLRRTDGVTTGDLLPYYKGELCVGAVCLATLLSVLAMLASSLRRSRREHRRWSARQRHFTGTAAGMLVMQVLYTACLVSAFASVVAQPDCRYPWKAISVLGFFQFVLLAAQLLFILARMSGLAIWRGPGALDMPPDYRLLLDRPLQDRARRRWVVLALWGLIVGLALARTIQQLGFEGADGGTGYVQGCDVPLNTWNCSPTAFHTTTAVASFAVVCIYTLSWAIYLRRALKDHALLPYCRYRSTLIFARVQAWIMAPVLLAILFSTGALSLAPAFTDSCWNLIDSQIANLPIYLALTVASLCLAILYMPREAVDSPVLQELLQVFTWTQAGIPAAVEEREALLQAAAGDQASGRQPGFGQPAQRLAQGLAWLARVPGVAEAAERLRKEPLFCVETAVKLFHWMRLAYREADALSNPYVNVATALSLFGLDRFEMIWDDDTDTHCCLGWSASRGEAVVAFRGTQTLQNLITDTKTWRSPLPGRSRPGRPVLVHAGFLQAWEHSGFSQKVLRRLREIDDGLAPLRFWLTGHSLGGALAELAALEIRREHPASRLTCYVFGCPRVGNAAFAAEFDQAVPDAWSIVNGLDPVPWVPKVGYASAGKQVTINHRGDIVLRPSFFEMAVVHGGTSLRHHMTSRYALSLAAVLKAQFVESKALEGGPQGVADLAAAVDLQAALVLVNADLASLQDPSLQPRSAEALAAKQEGRPQQQGGQKTRLPASWGSSCSAGCAGHLPFARRRGGGSAGSEDEEDSKEDEDEAVGREGVLKEEGLPEVRGMAAGQLDAGPGQQEAPPQGQPTERN